MKMKKVEMKLMQAEMKLKEKEVTVMTHQSIGKALGYSQKTISKMMEKSRQ